MKILYKEQKNQKQEYDFFGFPKEKYEIKYLVKGYEKLSDEILNMPEFDVEIDNRWGNRSWNMDTTHAHVPIC